MHALPSDRAVLQCIYDLYKDSYPGPKGATGRSENDPHLAIDIKAVASKLECSPELLFGRIYYHLDKKHRYKQEDGTLVPLFHLKAGQKRHAVNFPFLASILAGENKDFLRFVLPLTISTVAMVVSFGSLVVGLFLKR